jgi:hypothetical protein
MIDARAPASRRLFLRAFLATAGSAAAATLSACTAEVVEVVPTREAYTAPPSRLITPVEIAQATLLERGLRHTNTMPTRVPPVRLLATAGSAHAT